MRWRSTKNKGRIIIIIKKTAKMKKLLKGRKQRKGKWQMGKMKKK